jgi:DNA repair photolyase
MKSIEFKLPSGPAQLVALDNAPLAPIDILGRQKCIACGLGKDSAADEIKKAARPSFATIRRNSFKFKSLSCWSYNIGVGCLHGCGFCYVPDSQQTGVGIDKENNGHLATALREFGVQDPDAEWGQYLLLRPFDEKIFLASLKAAENTPLTKLNRDGNRAIMFCTTTDPYQVISIPGDPAKQKLLNGLRRHLVRRALELILEHSTLNVRILTRSPLAEQDFDVYRKFGNRLLFGMSLPTLRNDLARVYEPHAPAPTQRLATLQAAKQAGIHIYVAMAPTYPECDEADLRATMEAIHALHPVTLFHEPINIRGKNVERIAAHAANLGVTLRTGIFDSPTTWRRYALEQLCDVQTIAGELGMLQVLHLWPDKSLKSKNGYIKVQDRKARESHPGHRETRQEKQQRRAADEAEWVKIENWISFWHESVSRWPGQENGAVMATQLTPDEVSEATMVGNDNLGAEDRKFLEQQENIVRAGQKTFLAVGTALMHIRDYKDGLLYLPYGTFEKYCRQRWDLGRAHANRQMVAAGIFSEMSPRGDNPSAEILPSTERQLRELSRLPTAELRKAAWRVVVAAAGEKPISASQVAKAVHTLAESESGQQVNPSVEHPVRKKTYRIAAESLAKMRKGLKQLRAQVAKLLETPQITLIIDEIEGLLPDTEEK